MSHIRQKITPKKKYMHTQEEDDYDEEKDDGEDEDDELKGKMSPSLSKKGKYTEKLSHNRQKTTQKKKYMHTQEEEDEQEKVVGRNRKSFDPMSIYKLSWKKIQTNPSQ